MPKALLLDFTSECNGSVVKVKERLARNGLCIGRTDFRANTGSWMGAAQLTAIMHEGAPFELGWRTSGERAARHAVTTGQFHIAPAGKPAFVDWQGTQRAITVAMTASFVEKTVGEAFDGRLPELPATAAIRDPAVEELIATLRRGLKDHSRCSGLRLDHAGAMLALHLFESYGNGTAPRPTKSGGLGASRRRRVVDYIEAHLVEDLSLGDLAAEAGLSPHHFGKAFKASLGQSPWRYVNERRILRAKEMLREGDRSITEIAHDLGFASHSHFTDVFHKITGTTPSRFRRDYL